MSTPIALLAVFGHELRQAWRSVLARPGFSALAVLVLAAGLASALSIASFMNTLVLNPLPFANSDELLQAGFVDSGEPLDTHRLNAISSADVLDWQEALASMAQVGAYSTGTANLSADARSERYSGGFLSAGVLPALRVQPALGRAFVDADMAVGAPLVVLLADAVWRQRFNRDADILGRQIRVNNQPATVVGVMPPAFSFPMREQLWMPTVLARGDGERCCFEMLLRPHAGVQPGQIQQALDQWMAAKVAREPIDTQKRAKTVALDGLKYRFVDRDTIKLFVVMGLVVGLVLLIACANVANLLLSSLLARERELALRMALGAGRARLLLATLLQSGLLSLAALIIALPLAQLGVDALIADMRSTVDSGPPEWMVFAIDGRMVAIAAAVALLTALLSGLLPALHASGRRDLSLRSQAQGAGGFARVSQGLMVAQVGFSLAVLMTTMLLINTVRTLSHFDLGLDTSNVLTVRIGLSGEGFAEPVAQKRYVDDLLRTVRAEPGVASASISSSLPGLMGENVDALEQGAPVPKTGVPEPGFSAIDPEFFAALRASLVSGRSFSADDRADTERVAIVDQTFVDRYLVGKEPIGRQIVLDPSDDRKRVVTIVGVVRPIQMDDIDDIREASLFVPYAQEPARFFSLFVRTRGEPLAFAARLNQITQGIDVDTPLYWVREYSEVLREAMIGQHLLARLFTSFGVVALLLAAAGLYGVVAFNVGRRTREIGIRRALGAADGMVMRAVLLRTGMQVGVGLAVGLAIGFPFATLLGGLLGTVGEGTPKVDVFIWLPALLLLGAAAALASWLPARSALRVQPTIALRSE